MMKRLNNLNSLKILMKNLQLSKNKLRKSHQYQLKSQRLKIHHHLLKVNYRRKILHQVLRSLSLKILNLMKKYKLLLRSRRLKKSLYQSKNLRSRIHHKQSNNQNLTHLHPAAVVSAHSLKALKKQ